MDLEFQLISYPVDFPSSSGIAPGPPAYCSFSPTTSPVDLVVLRETVYTMWHTNDYLYERILKRLQLVRSKPQPTLARRDLLESKNARSDSFSGSSNVPLCADTYVCNNLQPEHRKFFQ